MDISVAILVYKSNYKSVLATVMSVIKQSYQSYEIVISDDGTDSLDYDSLKNEIESKWQGKLIILNNPENVGTIQHCINVASVCTGRYIKLLGAGDLLHDPYSLQSIVDFMDKNYLKVGIGRITGYTRSSNKTQLFTYKAPLYDVPYLEGNIKSIRRNLVYMKDWICGASMFFNREYMIEKFKVLGEHLRYVEDLSEYLVVFDNEKIMMMDQVIVYYELNSGISTNPTESTSSFTKNDFISFWRMIENYTDDPKEAIRFRAYAKIESLTKSERYKGLLLRFRYDRWFYVMLIRRRLVNGVLVKKEKTPGFLSEENPIMCDSL